MKKSVVYRTLQVASAVGIYSVVSVWASKNHVNIVSSVLTQIDSILVILAIAVALPYFCFKVLSKLYTPPISSSSEQSSKDATATFDQDELQAQQDMFYRGTAYNSAESRTTSANDRQSVTNPQPAIKYRGASVISNAEASLPEKENQFSAERAEQKPAKPKERIKYRGSYVD